MTTPKTSLRIALASSLSFLLLGGVSLAAGRGGGGGGGFRGGGMGGGGMSRPSMSHTPSFSAPRAQPSFSGGGGFNPAAGGGGYRPPGGGGAVNNRANIGGNANINNRAYIGGNTNLNNRANVGGNTNVNNRANFGGNTNVNNRANIGGNTNVNNRANIGGNTNVNNRANFGGNTNINNRANFGGNANINNRPVNITNNNFTSNRFNNINNNNRWAARSPYYGYHQGWVNGSWNYHYPGYYGNWGLGGFGLGLATGLASWGLYSSLSNWGYSSYNNPYYYSAPATVVVQQQAPVYDYSQPINTLSAPPAPSTADDAVATFDDARAAFKAGDYAQALQKTDAALVKMPNDPTLHEFRALVLFAQKQYDPAASALFAVLSTGPGWDWTTMVGLYPNVDVYTAQLRALEDFSKANPNLPSAHFVLAYHYLTQGYPDNAAIELKEVTRLQPTDALSARMLAEIAKPATTPGAGAAVAAAPPPQTAQEPAPAAASAPAPPGGLVGTWVASPTKDTTITLTVKDDGDFTWEVADKGGPRKITGTSTLGNGILTLASQTGDPLVGRVLWGEPGKFTFQAAGGGPNDPGLAFQKKSG
jgi:tetratricopeptide (TPR) repeat protein